MSRFVLFCEGPEDLAALREVILRQFAFAKPVPSLPPPIPVLVGELRRERLVKADLSLDLIIAGDRERVGRLAADLASYDSPQDPIARIGLSFDPNGSNEPLWREWLEGSLQALRLSRAGWVYAAQPEGRTALEVVPLPWSWPGPVVYGLGDSHCLERVAVDLLGEASPVHHQRLGRWIDELRAEPGATAPTWKTAARLWNALALPDVAGAGFYAQVFGQNPATASVLGSKLAATDLGAALASFLRPTPAAATP